MRYANSRETIDTPLKPEGTKVFAVFGYNNTRLYDVERLGQLMAERYQAKLLLIKKDVSAEDYNVTPFCFDEAPESVTFSEAFKTYLLENNLILMGLLPFSDKGVVGGATMAKVFNLFGDDVETAEAMLDKFKFRELEKKFQIDEQVYKKPFFEKVHAEVDLYRLLKEKGAYFLKPTSEGNSRGCMKITSTTDLKNWLVENARYLKSGVSCEEIINGNKEYSFDGVAGNYWITEKFTTEGAYRAEYQHIVPAPLKENQQDKIHQVLRPLLKHLGSNGGAFHHEFFDLHNGRLASVEPNRRPAGMWIWDLAQWSFENFNPWTDWLDRCAGKETESRRLKAQSFSGVRAVISNHTGVLVALPEDLIRIELDEVLGREKYRLSFFKKTGDVVQSLPRDNADFIAFVALKNANYDHLLVELELATNIVVSHLQVASIEESGRFRRVSL